MNKASEQLAFKLLFAAKTALGEHGSTTSPADRQRLYEAVVAIEDACVKDGVMRWKNAGEAAK